MSHLTRIGVCILVGIGLAQSVGCTRHEAGDRARESQLQEAAERRAARAKSLQGMSGTDLVADLARESSRGVESFNSTAYREAARRGRKIAPDLLSALSRLDSGQLLPLLALREVSAADYARVPSGARASILVGTLQHARFFNAWGIPHLFWEDAAKATIEMGAAADSALVGLLRDERPAPVWGSESAGEASRYRYRVKDYAWAMLLAIRKRPSAIPESPAERDRLIQSMSR
jgi:hypothetical protein